MASCPLSEIGQALRPFIKPREEATAIRLNLHASLETHLQRDGLPLSVANLVSPTTQQEVGDSPPAFSGVRRAYWNALQAHHAAQVRYDALKAELRELGEDNDCGDETEVGASASHISESYIPRLRQREKQRRLLVLERSLSDINAIGKQIVGGSSLDDLARSRVGEPPLPPCATTIRASHASSSEDSILQLKKAVLAAKHSTDAQNAVPFATSDGHFTPAADAELHALRKAHSVLTSWMEDQLALIADAGAKNEALPPSPATCGPQTERPISHAEIASLYDQYLLARRNLVENMSGRPEAGIAESAPAMAMTTEAKGTKESEKTSNSATILLPYIPRLLLLKQQEHALLQQSAYTRRQLSNAESESEHLIARLADESHLVHPGASRGRDWAAAAEEASRSTEAFARQRVQAGDSAALKAEKVLQAIGDAPKALDRLVNGRV